MVQHRKPLRGTVTSNLPGSGSGGTVDTHMDALVRELVGVDVDKAAYEAQAEHIRTMTNRVTERVHRLSRGREGLNEQQRELLDRIDVLVQRLQQLEPLLLLARDLKGPDPDGTVLRIIAMVEQIDRSPLAPKPRPDPALPPQRALEEVEHISRLGRLYRVFMARLLRGK